MKTDKWLVWSIVVVWVGLAGIGIASACLNDSLADIAERRYRSEYQQVYADSLEDRRGLQDHLTADGAHFRHPLYPVSDIHQLENHLSALAEPSFAVSWWLKMSGLVALAVALMGIAFTVGRKRRSGAWRAYAGEDAGEPVPTLLGASAVGTAIVVGIALAASIVLADHVVNLDMPLTRTLVPAPVTQVPPPHQFPVEKERSWQRSPHPDAAKAAAGPREFDPRELDELRKGSFLPGGGSNEPVTLRFAMVHDILHERYVRPGQSYYRARNKRSGQEFDRLDKRWEAHKKPRPPVMFRGTELELPEDPKKKRPPAKWFGHIDDLAVGLERLGELDEAEELLRRKLRVQEAADIPERARYTTYANLGTVLAHASVRGTLAGDGEARQRLQEALSFIDQAIAANPNAHFGREVWQKAAIEYLLAASEDPEIFRRYDMVGNRLDSSRSYKELRDGGAGSTYVGRELAEASRPLFAKLSFEFEPKDYEYTPPSEVEPEWIDLDEPGSESSSADRERVGTRDYIRKVGAEGDWSDLAALSQDGAVSFDDPVLGIVGMWRLGGGPNPHFALTLGGIMERVGRPRLAWAAYERAVRMKDGWPEAAREHLVDHSRARQAELAVHLLKREGGSAADLRDAFEAELDRGLAYQAKHRRYEDEMIAAGNQPDPGFYDAFFDEHGSIATAPGADEKVAVIGWMRPDWRTAYAAIPWMLLMGGLFGLIRALTFSVTIRE